MSQSRLESLLYRLVDFIDYLSQLAGAVKDNGFWLEFSRRTDPQLPEKVADQLRTLEPRLAEAAALVAQFRVAHSLPTIERVLLIAQECRDAADGFVRDCQHDRAQKLRTPLENWQDATDVLTSLKGWETATVRAAIARDVRRLSLALPAVSLNPPHITIDGTPYAISEDQALYLMELSKLPPGEWMSAGEFKKRCPQVGESARPDRWRKRKGLPSAVKARLETSHRGTRWRLPAD